MNRALSGISCALVWVETLIGDEEGREIGVGERPRPLAGVKHAYYILHACLMRAWRVYITCPLGWSYS